MTIHELEYNDLESSRRMKLKNRKELQNSLEIYLKGILENIDKCTDYDIYKILEMCEFALSTISISQLWETKK